MTPARLRIALSSVVISAIATIAFGQQIASGPFTSRADMNARLAALIHERLVARQPLRLSADAITLTGDTLRLAGHATVSFDDTSVVADETTIDRDTSRVELSGTVHATLGQTVRDRLGVRTPRPQWR
jgi:hypothetical protein